MYKGVGLIIFISFFLNILWKLNYFIVIDYSKTGGGASSEPPERHYMRFCCSHKNSDFLTTWVTYIGYAKLHEVGRLL